MLICSNCKTVFTDSEIRWERDEFGEWEARCPCCNWGYPEEAKTCKICGEDCLEDDMLEGYCMECLEEALTFETFLEFSLDGFSEYECSLFEEFMFTKIYGWEYDDVPNVTTPMFREVLVDDYKAKTSNAFNDFILDLIKDYMRGYMSEFAEYLSEKEAKECTKQKTDGEQ